MIQKMRTSCGVKEILKEGVSCVGIFQMEEFTGEFTRYHPNAELIMMNMLSAHKNRGANQSSTDLSLLQIFCHRQTAKLSSLLENPLFGIFKSSLRKKDDSTLEKKRIA
jgi:hypothetical protein